jgi:undecaprenyl-diphosphatase
LAYDWRSAIVLLGFYAKEWLRLITGFFGSIFRRYIETDSERLAWLVVIATVPVGILGLALAHVFWILFAKPVAASLFLMANGVILFACERHRRRTEKSTPPVAPDHSGRARFRDRRIVPSGTLSPSLSCRTSGSPARS